MEKRRPPRHRDDIQPFYEPLAGKPKEASPLQRKASLRVLNQSEKANLIGDTQSATHRVREQFMGNKYATPWKSLEPEMRHLHNAVSLAKQARVRLLHAQAAKKGK